MNRFESIEQFQTIFENAEMRNKLADISENLKA